MSEGSDGGDGTNGSDGMAFVIQNSSAAALGGGAGGIGYNGMPNSLVVEFDTWNNSEAADPSHSHISVHTRGAEPNDPHEDYSLGVYDTIAAAGFILDDAEVHSVTVAYTADTETLTVTLDSLGVVITASVNIAETLDLDSGRAWVGFVGATGGGWQNHDVVSWEYESAADMQPVLTIGNATQLEGDDGQTSFDFPVTVTRPETVGPLTVMVDYETTDGTATAASRDYDAAAGTLTFNLADGEAEVTETISSVVNGDVEVEDFETFWVDLSEAAGAVIPYGRGLGTIENDDAAIVIDDVTVTEGDATPRFIDAFVTADSNLLAGPNAMAIGPDGNWYVAGQNSDNVVRYDAVTGAMIDEFVAAASGGLDGPRGLVFDPEGNLLVASGSMDCVLRYQGPAGAMPGAFMDTFVDVASGGLDAPYRAVFGPDGNLYVASGATDNVLRYQGPSGVSPGEFIDEFVTAGSGGLDAPTSLVFDLAGDLLVANGQGDNILRFQGPSNTAPGQFVDEFVTAGSGGLDVPAHAHLWS